MQKFWIDTDTASDDAVAILMALRWPDTHIAGMSIVSGNVPVEMGARNALYTAELAERETPVYLGMDRPLVRAARYAHYVHGPDGMGGMNYPLPKRPLEKAHAVNALIEAVRAAPGEISLITLGPLTNIAVALRMAPDLAQKIPICYVMGGAAATLGNVTPAAEFNIWVDPEAAHIVFHSEMPLLMVGIEHCLGDAALDVDDQAYIRSFNNPLADFVLDCNRTLIQFGAQMYGEPVITLPDPITVAVALNPALCTQRSKHFVDIETSSEVTRGMTVVDKLNAMSKLNDINKSDLNSVQPNVEVCWSIDIALWKDMLYRAIR